jgi:hypothetical protein
LDLSIVLLDLPIDVLDFSIGVLDFSIDVLDVSIDRLKIAKRLANWLVTGDNWLCNRLFLGYKNLVNDYNRLA